jgi:hypothetical protein
MASHQQHLEQAAELLAELNGHYEGAGIPKMENSTMARYLGISLKQLRVLLS